jgi:hypothetical protein
MLLHIKIHIVADETKTEALSKELPWATQSAEEAWIFLLGH